MSKQILIFLALSLSLYCIKGRPTAISSLTFLVSVNDTWGDCFTTVKTPSIAPNTAWNKSVNVIVGNCDHGALRYTVVQNEVNDGVTVDVTFYSHVIEDASHPECRINWNYQYLTPKNSDPSSSVLPGCFVADSREGYHMTNYWFYIIDWTL